MLVFGGVIFGLIMLFISPYFKLEGGTLGTGAPFPSWWWFPRLRHQTAAGLHRMDLQGLFDVVWGPEKLGVLSQWLTGFESFWGFPIFSRENKPFKVFFQGPGRLSEWWFQICFIFWWLDVERIVLRHLSRSAWMEAWKIFFIFTFHPKKYLGIHDPNLTIIFFKRVGWNHQLENCRHWLVRFSWWAVMSF